MLGQLLRHIIENAVKYSPEGQPVEVTVRRNGTRLAVVVADRGPGFAEDFLDAWDPFTQKDQSNTRVNRGLGLGLFAASKLARILGGSVLIAPRAGGGTIATIEVEVGDPNLLGKLTR